MQGGCVKESKRISNAREWQFQEAQNRLSQVVDSALHNGPQTIILRGKPAAVVISFEEFRSLTQRQTKLSQFFRQSPLLKVELDLERSPDLGCKVEL
jgi:prevent-host-death family protein